MSIATIIKKLSNTQSAGKPVVSPLKSRRALGRLIGSGAATLFSIGAMAYLPSSTALGDINILYYTDYSLGTDRMAAALLSLPQGYSVTTATSDADFKSKLQTGNYQVGVLAVQNNSASDYVSPAALGTFAANGGTSIYCDWSKYSAVAASFDASYSGAVNSGSFTVSDANLITLLGGNTVTLTNPGWFTFSTGLTALTGGTSLASFANGDAAIVMGNNGNTLINGFLMDTVSSSTLFTAELLLLTGLQTAYWSGTTSALWTDSNWASDANGTAATRPVTGFTDVIFSANGALNQNTTLGANYSIHSLTVEDPAGITIGGAYTLTTGSISIEAGAGLTTISSNLVLSGSSGLVTVNNVAGLAVTSVISGTQGLTKAGTGTLTLSGANTYTGATHIAAGTLSAGAANTVPVSSAVTVDNGATFALNGFDQSIGSLAGDGSVMLGAAILTTGNDNTSTTFSGVISGDGGITKTGTGTLILDSENTYTGQTTVQNGALMLNGSIAGSVTVEGGLLGGNGYIEGNLINQSVVSPGNSPGTILIGGNYTQTSTGTLVVQIASLSVFDKLVIAGQANVNGTLQVSSLNGYTPKRGDTFAFLMAAGGVTGTFSNIEIDSPLKLKLMSDASENLLYLGSAQGLFADIAGMTPNERAVAKGLDKIVNDPKAAKLIDNLDGLSRGAILQKLDKIAPTDLIPMFDAVFSTNQVQAFNLERRMGQIQNGETGFSTSGLSLTDSHGSLSSNGNPDGKRVIGKDGKELAPTPISDRWGFFINGSGEFVDEESSAGARGTDFTTGGISTGVDYRLGNHAAVGVTAGYANTSSDGLGNGTVKIDGGKAGVYATVFDRGFFLNSMVGGGINSYDTKRETVGGLGRGDTTGSDFNTLLGTGYTYRKGGFSAGPIASIRYSWVGIDGFTEHGSLAPLKIGEQSENSLKTTTGMQASYTFTLHKTVVTPQVRAQWQHEYLNASRGIGASFLPGGAFTVNGPEIGADSLLVDAGATVQLTHDVSVYGFYTGDIGRTNYSSHTVSGGVQITF